MLLGPDEIATGSSTGIAPAGAVWFGHATPALLGAGLLGARPGGRVPIRAVWTWSRHACTWPGTAASYLLPGYSSGSRPITCTRSRPGILRC
jgi:hypothetical protein